MRKITKEILMSCEKNTLPSDKELQASEKELQVIEALYASYQARSLLFKELLDSHSLENSRRSPYEKHKHDPGGFKRLKFVRICNRVRQREAEILELLKHLKKSIEKE